MNSCFVSFTFLCFQSVLRLCCIFLYLFHLFWRANQLNSKSLKVAVSFRQQDIFGILLLFPTVWWKFVVERCQSGLTRTTRQPAVLKVSVQPLRQRHLRTFCLLGTNICFENFLTFFCSFSIEISTENVIEVFIFLSFHW